MTSTTTTNIENQNKNGKPEMKFRRGEVSEEIKTAIKDAWDKCCSLSTLPKICEFMKKELDEKQPKGWVVFGGKHITGVFSHISGTFYEFESDNTIFIIFKTFYISK